jgi:hypothetical protein
MVKRLDTPSSEAWAQVVAAEPGHVFYDAIEEGVRILVVRGPASLCAYLGVPKDHPLAGFDYNDLVISVHGGLTYGSTGGKEWPEGFYWYGWDYAHCDDYSTYYDDGRTSEILRNGHKWTVEEVVKEAKEACWDFRRLMKLAEKCAMKDSGYQIARKV